jgi:hypothetical protein
MTGVVLRCPNCGTSTSAMGECHACHDGQVRYYCTNHQPGVWLDAPSCLQCGAGFGDPVRAPTRPTPPRAPSRPRPPLATPAPTVSRSPPTKTVLSPWGRRDRRRAPSEEASELADERHIEIRTARMLEILKAASRVGRPREREDVTPLAVSAGAALGGCALRLIILVLFLLVVFSLLLSIIGGTLLEAVYY